MKGKFLLLQIEKACLENRLDYRDLLQLGIELQRKAIDEQFERVQQICRQFEEPKKKQNVVKLNWN